MVGYRFGLLFSFLFFWSFQARGQWQWLGSGVGPINTADSYIATDDSGNVYVAGAFTSNSFQLNLSILYNDSTGGEDIFLAKINPAGSVLWERRIGGRGSDRVRGLAVDKQGNISITGDFTGTQCNFDTISVYGSGCSKFFVAHYAPDGSVRWVRTYNYAANWPGCPETYGSDITTSANGHIFATMYFAGTIVLGTDTFRTSLYDRYESLILKFDILGNVLWSKQLYSEPYTFVVVTSIAVDSLQNVYGTGFSDGNTQVAAPVSASGGGYRWKHFLFKLDSAGAGRHISKLYSNSCCDYNLYRVAVDARQHVYVAGTFGNANTDSLKLGTTAIVTTAPGTSDVFLAQYDTALNLHWVRAVTGSGNDYLNGLATNNRGETYVAGSFYSPSITFGSSVLNRQHAFNAYFAAYDSSGAALFAKSANDGGNHSIADITCGKAGDLYIAGNYDDSLTLGSFNARLLPTGGINAYFFAKYYITGLEGIQSPPSISINIWPNPCTSQGALQLSTPVEQAILTDITGRVVAKWWQPGQTLQLPELTAGLYFLQTTADNVDWGCGTVSIE